MRDLPKQATADDAQLGRMMVQVGQALMSGATALTAQQRSAITKVLTLPGGNLTKHATTRDTQGSFG